MPDPRPLTVDDLTAHAEEERGAHADLATRQARIEEALIAVGTSGMRTADVAEARLAFEREERERVTAARVTAAADEAKAAADRWARVTASLQGASENWMVRLVVLAVLVTAFPAAQRYIDRFIGLGTAVAVEAPAPAAPAPAPVEP